MTTHFLNKVTDMLQNLRRRIFGVGPDHLAAGPQAVARQAESDPPQFLPEGHMTDQMIRGVDWKPWRVDANGTQFYRRISSDAPAAEIEAEADLDDFDDVDGGERTTDQILEDFRRNIAIIKARHARGELTDSDDADDYPDDGEFGEDDDEA